MQSIQQNKGRNENTNRFFASVIHRVQFGAIFCVCVCVYHSGLFLLEIPERKKCFICYYFEEAARF